MRLAGRFRCGCHRGFAVDQFHDEEIGADVVDGADVRMIRRGDGAYLTVEALAESFLGNLDGDFAVEPGIESLVDPAHASGTEKAENPIGSQLRARAE